MEESLRTDIVLLWKHLAERGHRASWAKLQLKLRSLDKFWRRETGSALKKELAGCLTCCGYRLKRDVLLSRSAEVLSSLEFWFHSCGLWTTNNHKRMFPKNWSEQRQKRFRIWRKLEDQLPLWRHLIRQTDLSCRLWVPEEGGSLQVFWSRNMDHVSCLLPISITDSWLVLGLPKRLWAAAAPAEMITEAADLVQDNECIVHVSHFFCCWIKHKMQSVCSGKVGLWSCYSGWFNITLEGSAPFDPAIFPVSGEEWIWQWLWKDWWTNLLTN